jgi:hypothetical protein
MIDNNNVFHRSRNCFAISPLSSSGHVTLCGPWLGCGPALQPPKAQGGTVL